MDTVQLDNCTVILQLYYNTVYQTGCARYLPKADQYEKFHVTGCRLRTRMTLSRRQASLPPIIKVLGHSRKIFLTLLTRHYHKPCCEGQDHNKNYTLSSCLPALSASVFRLRDHIRDTLFTGRTRHFKVLCLNRMLGLEPQLTDKATKGISMKWDAVLPLRVANKTIAEVIVSNIMEEGAR
jgi:hypothetical protein